jgi:hypothetical protein
MKMLIKILKLIGFVASILFSSVLLLLVYFNLPVMDSSNKAGLGITYSWKYAEDVGLDWQETYLAILDDLKVKKIRLPVYWNDVEKKEGQYDFSKIDWQLQEAKKRNVDIILAVGQKTPRWPECFIPDWASVSDAKRKTALLGFIETTVKRYKDDKTIAFWQVENEPLLNFGICPTINPALLDMEIAVARKLDPERKIIVTDSGELSLWVQAAKRADVFGTTLYRSVVSEKLNLAMDYPIGPNFFKFKRLLIRLFAGQKNAIVVELQGEPWIRGWTINAPVSEQLASMNAGRLEDNIKFAEKAGFSEVYVWGAEWWYWMKTKQNHPEIWEMAKNMFEKNGK